MVKWSIAENWKLFPDAFLVGRSPVNVPKFMVLKLQLPVFPLSSSSVAHQIGVEGSKMTLKSGLAARQILWWSRMLDETI